jgi:hypothetical protein
MIITAHINQADVIRLQTGQEVDIQVESVPGLKMKGRMERIAPQAILKNGIKGFTARVQITDIDRRIRPGMTAILTIPVATAENVLAVPLAAIHSDRGDRFVYVKEADRFVPRPVVIGITDYMNAEVQQGLAEGDVVALEQITNDEIAKIREAGAKPAANRNGEAAPAKPSAPPPATTRPTTTQTTAPNRAAGS